MKVDGHYDLLVVGGGISGAAVLYEAARRGLRVLLVDRGDFAGGTSSASSKLIHGGLRYLKGGQWRLTRESVRERERLLVDRPGLVTAQAFLMPDFAGDRPGPTALGAAFWIADTMAGRRTSGRIDAADAVADEPLLKAGGLRSAIAYRDGVVDDSRLVLRLIFDAVQLGAHALNHVAATLLEQRGRIVGASLTDPLGGEQYEVTAAVTVHAAGVRAGQAPGAPRLRPLRGSHLVFPHSLLPLRCGLAWMHPHDRRPVFAFPWEGAVVVGTTDVDHDGADNEPSISAAEAAYLVEGLRKPLPQLALRPAMAISAYAGLRAIVVPPGSEGEAAPSAMARDSALWSRPGLVGITGGKLTTHRASALAVLREAARQGLGAARQPAAAAPVAGRLAGRLGADGAAWVAARPADEQRPLLATPYTLAELRWSLHAEQVRRLDDLLLRRTRLGLVAADGAAALLPLLEAPCREALGWDAGRWADECARYRQTWAALHAPPTE